MGRLRGSAAERVRGVLRHRFRGAGRLALSVSVVALAMAVSQATAETTTYTYDARGRLVGVSVSSGATTTYTYDANDNRVQVTVTGGTNLAPTAVNDSVSTPKNQALGFNPRTNDSDPNGDTITITGKTNGNQGGVVAITGGGTGLSYTPATNFTGQETFTYTISDGSLTSTATVTATVTGNSPPVANDDMVDANAYCGTTYAEVTFDPRTNDTDADSNPLTITGVTQGASGTVTLSGSQVSYTYNEPQTPSCMDAWLIDADSFTYTISDGQGGTSTATVNVNIVVW